MRNADLILPDLRNQRSSMGIYPERARVPVSEQRWFRRPRGLRNPAGKFSQGQFRDQEQREKHRSRNRLQRDFPVERGAFGRGSRL